MPLAVITIKNSPNSLRGDLTKWMQEIATGVYVGNFNSKIREELWKRVCETIGTGEATLSYADRNEIGYQFKTWKTHREVIDYDGIPLVYIPKEIIKNSEEEKTFGFSKAYKFHQARKFRKIKKTAEKARKSDIMLCIEFVENKIQIEMFKTKGGDEKEIKNIVINQDNEDSINIFLGFIENLPILGYDIKQSIMQLKKYLKKQNRGIIKNEIHDMKILVEKEKILADYEIETVFKEYGIEYKGDKKGQAYLNALNMLKEKVIKF